MSCLRALSIDLQSVFQTAKIIEAAPGPTHSRGSIHHDDDRRLSLPATLSFDHLGRAQQDGRGHLQPERLGGAEIDVELKPRRLQHRQVRRPGALENSSDIKPHLSPTFVTRSAVTHKASGSDEFTP